MKKPPKPKKFFIRKGAYDYYVYRKKSDAMRGTYDFSAVLCPDDFQFVTGIRLNEFEVIEAELKVKLVPAKK